MEGKLLMRHLIQPLIALLMHQDMARTLLAVLHSEEGPVVPSEGCGHSWALRAQLGAAAAPRAASAPRQLTTATLALLFVLFA